MAILSPNEARGTGGFLGNYAIITSQDGKVSIDTVGSNTDLPDLKRLPASLDRQFRDHYGDAPLQRGTMNLSPHLPDTAAIWLKSWRQRTGQRLDGVIAVDVIALSRMVGASGQPIPLPEGGSIGGADLARFATQGIYEKFPRADQDTQRNAYQVAILTSALESIVRPPRPEAMAKAIGEALSTHRMVVWSGDPDVERRLLAAEVGGSLRVPDGHQVEAIVLSTSNSKLDAYLDRWLTYEVGRCVDEGGRVQSHVTFTLENAIPFGQRPRSTWSAQRQWVRPVRSIPAASRFICPTVPKCFRPTWTASLSTIRSFASKGGPPSCSTWNCPRERRGPWMCVSPSLTPQLSQRWQCSL